MSHPTSISSQVKRMNTPPRSKPYLMPSSAEIDATVALRSVYAGVRPAGNVGSEPPTPRQLKQFVNQIGSIRRVRDDITLPEIGYYVLLRRDREDIVGLLQSGSIPQGDLAFLFED